MRLLVAEPNAGSGAHVDGYYATAEHTINACSDSRAVVSCHRCSHCCPAKTFLFTCCPRPVQRFNGPTVQPATLHLSTTCRHKQDRPVYSSSWRHTRPFSAPMLASRPIRTSTASYPQHRVKTHSHTRKQTSWPSSHPTTRCASLILLHSVPCPTASLRMSTRKSRA
jgi:hypothetical protein